MGNWRHRRRFYRQRPPKSPPSYSLDIEPPSSGFSEDGVPFWEKKFCTLIGRVPWQKIVDTRKFMFSSNVLDWDDSAGKDAFQNAKNRFWAEINGLPCDVSLPDPDIYIDEVNWNPDIDPELIRDIDSAYFAPDEGEKEGKFGRRQKKSRNFTYDPPKGHGENSGLINYTWEVNDNMQGSGALNDGAQGWNQPNNGDMDLKNIRTDDNPWESTCAWGNEVVKKKVQGWNQWDGNNNDLEKLNRDNNPWNRSLTWDNEAARDNTCGSWDDKLWGSNQGINPANWLRKLDNGNKDLKKNDDNPWESTCPWGNEVVKNEVQGWNRWDDNRNDSGRLNSDNNSWDRSLTWGNEAARNKTWGSCEDKLWGAHQGADHANWFSKGNISSSWSQHKSSKFDSGDHRLKHNYSGTHRDRGRRDCSRGNEWGWNQWDNSNNEPRNSENGTSGGGGRTWNENSRKRFNSRTRFSNWP